MHWTADPILIRIGGLTIFWYGFLFMLGLLATVWMGHKYFVERGIEEKHASNLTFFLIAGLFLGAHVLDVIAYNWEAFIADPSILFQFKHGLSSHGGGLGVLFAGMLYVRIARLDFHRVGDAVILAAVWLFPFIRVGNFFNSEVVGLPTSLPWGVVFDLTGLPEPRHPSQLYEAALGITLICIGTWLHTRHRWTLRKGATFYMMLGGYFAVRFVLEFAKERQAVSAGFPLNMGQLLSLPAALACGLMLWRRGSIVVPAGDDDASDPRPRGATDPIGHEPAEPSTETTEPS